MVGILCLGESRREKRWRKTIFPQQLEPAGQNKSHLKSRCSADINRPLRLATPPTWNHMLINYLLLADDVPWAKGACEAARSKVSLTGSFKGAIEEKLSFSTCIRGTPAPSLGASRGQRPTQLALGTFAQSRMEVSRL